MSSSETRRSSEFSSCSEGVACGTQGWAGQGCFPPARVTLPTTSPFLALRGYPSSSSSTHRGEHGLTEATPEYYVLGFWGGEYPVLERNLGGGEGWE